MLALTNVFFLKKGIKIVIGYSNAALYDLANGRVYLVSKKTGELLSKFNTQALIEEALKKKILDLGLGTYNINEAEIQPTQFDYDSFDDCYLSRKCTLLYIEITDVCNFHCIHCYANIEICNNKIMNVEQFKKILDSVSDDNSCDIRLTGGEPFLNKNIREFVSITSNSISPKNCHSIVTNGTFDVEDALYALKKGFELQISIYGMSYEKFHEFTNATKKSWDSVLDNLSTLSKSEYKGQVVLCFAINKITYNELNDFISFAKKYGFRYILNRPASTGRAVKNWDKLQLSTKDHYDFSKMTQASRMRFCFHMCQLHLSVVCANGDVIPCSFLRKSRYIFGNIYETSLDSIWNSQKYMAFRALTPSMVSKCSDCEFIYACSAGCCAEAEGYNNDVLSCYPWCHLKPYEKNYMQISDEEIVFAEKLAAGTFLFERIE